ncbi:MAG TPA: metallophosphoesterase family protein [Planctomycetota bacterium]|jgi:putative phosphoesterase|nr:metallophosphoesterase family protein [Planctomycetota bacterium]
MWIGVINDTEGYVESSARDIFEGVDYILHCGNVGSVLVLEDLSLVAPVTGVIGPKDDAELFPFGTVLFKKWFETGIYLRHQIGDPFDAAEELRGDLDLHKPEVVLFGSGGRAFKGRIENRLYFNPGSCGHPGPGRIRSIGLLEIEGQSIRAEVVPIEN